MEKGLYFYKLESPYPEDVTKNCKLTVNEIDHNFLTLKDMDVKDAHFDEQDSTLIIERNNGDNINVDLTPLVDNISDLDVEYDPKEGNIVIIFNNKKIVINGLVTDENLSSEIMTEVITDSTMKGMGTDGSPLGVSPVELTNSYKAAIRLIDLTTCECMPLPKYLKKGDRFLSYEKVSDYGYLYDYRGVKKISDDLKNGWRIPTKEDWDNMLNAIEPCAEFRNHNSIMGNQVLGKIAGKLLKSVDKWEDSDTCIPFDSSTITECKTNTCTLDDVFDADFDGVCGDVPSCRPPKPKAIFPQGTDSYGMAIVPSGYGDGARLMDYFGKRGAYWTYTMSHVSDVYVKRFDYNKSGVVQSIEAPSDLFSLRLVKDYDGSNHKDVEFINGMNYSTKLMPSLNSKHGYAIWTASNVAFKNDRYKPVEPNGGLGVTYRKVYYINEWDGFNWIRKELREGDKITLINGLDGAKNIEYQIINGTLVSTAQIVYDRVMMQVTPEIERIDESIEGIKDRLDSVEDKVNSLENESGKLREELEQEVQDRYDADCAIWDNLKKEISVREEADKLLKDLITNESSIREQIDNQLWQAISKETSDREDSIDELNSKLEEEAKTRETSDKEITEALEAEIDIRTKEDKKLGDLIKLETELREEADDNLTDAIESEAVTREDADKYLETKLDTEITERKEEDDKINERIDNINFDLNTSISDLKDKLNAEIEQRQEEDVNLNSRIDDETKERKAEDDKINRKVDELEAKVDAEIVAREEADKALNEKIDAETRRATEEEARIESKHDEEVQGLIEQDELIKGRLISPQGNVFDCENGVFTLKTDNPDNTITIQLTGNYGTF